MRRALAGRDFAVMARRAIRWRVGKIATNMAIGAPGVFMRAHKRETCRIVVEARQGCLLRVGVPGGQGNKQDKREPKHRARHVTHDCSERPMPNWVR